MTLRIVPAAVRWRRSESSGPLPIRFFRNAQTASTRAAVAGRQDRAVRPRQVHDAPILAADLEIARPHTRGTRWVAVVQRLGRQRAEHAPAVATVQAFHEVRTAL